MTSSTMLLVFILCSTCVTASMFDFLNVSQVESFINSASIPVYKLDHCQTRDYCDSVAQNGICDPVCDNEECGFDGGDCRETMEMLTCPKSCAVLMANGICNLDCNVELCGFDGGDCAFDGYAASQSVSLIFETTPKIPSARMLKEKLSQQLNLPVIFDIDAKAGSAAVHLLNLKTYAPIMIVNPASVLPVGSLLRADVRIDFRYCGTPGAVCRFSNAVEFVNWINAEPIEYLLDEFDIVLYQADSTATVFSSNDWKFDFFGIEITPMVIVIIAGVTFLTILILIVIITCCQSPSQPAVESSKTEPPPCKGYPIHHSTPIMDRGNHSCCSRVPLWPTHSSTVLTTGDAYFNNQTPRSQTSEFHDSSIVIQKHTMHHFTDVTPKRYSSRTRSYRIPSPISTTTTSSDSSPEPVQYIYRNPNSFHNDDSYFY